MTVIATDLDRTMIYSRNAVGPGFDESDLVCVEYYQGAPLSYMTVTAVAALRKLAAGVRVVPTTTRTIEQFERIELPGAPWRYAITSNGGNILVDGVADRQWRASIEDSTHRGGASLSAVATELRHHIDDDWVDKFRIADDLFCYLVVRPELVPADFRPRWGRWCAERGWTVSQQGRKIYMMPQAICKSRAIAEVRSRLVADGEIDSDNQLLAAGDGGLDAEMLASADAAIRPRHGELHTLGWTNPNLTITEGTGILAGEEILRWFAERVARRGPS
ncbi:MAG: HAD family hydrolase [Mycobacterium sp.]